MTARDQIKAEEGCVLVPYQCPAGLWTIGYGHCLERRPLPSLIEEWLRALGYKHWRDDRRPWPQEIVEELFEIDYRETEEDVLRHLPWARTLSEPRYAVLMSMAYQMGTHGLLGFRKALAALQAGDYNLAAIEMLESEWAGLTGPRARRLSTQMREGRWIERSATC